jgi:hypothetical protein
LVGRDLCRAPPPPGEIGIGGKILKLVIRLEFDAGVVGLGVVECGQDERLSELPVIEEIGRAFIIGIDAGLKTGERNLI